MSSTSSFFSFSTTPSFLFCGGGGSGSSSTFGGGGPGVSFGMLLVASLLGLCLGLPSPGLSRQHVDPSSASSSGMSNGLAPGLSVEKVQGMMDSNNHIGSIGSWGDFPVDSDNMDQRAAPADKRHGLPGNKAAAGFLCVPSMPACREGKLLAEFRCFQPAGQCVCMCPVGMMKQVLNAHMPSGRRIRNAAFKDFDY